MEFEIAAFLFIDGKFDSYHFDSLHNPNYFKIHDIFFILLIE